MPYLETPSRWQKDCPVPVQVLPAGTLLFHGTDCDNFNEADEPLWGPAWLSESATVAEHFARRSGGWGGPRRVVVYRVAEPVTLPLVSQGADMDQLADAFDLALLGVEEMRDSVQRAGLPGWWIANNYPTGSDILLSRTDCLDYIETRPLKDT